MSRARRSWSWLGRSLATVAVLAATTPTAAEAHHALSSFGLALAEPRSSLELEVSVTEFDLEGQRGRYLETTPFLEYRVTSAFSLSARLPFAHVLYGDGRTETGLAGPELGAKLSVYQAEDRSFFLSLGTGVELPIGQEGTGLGGGHVEISPFVALSVTPHRSLTLVAVLRDQVSVGGHGHHHHGVPGVTVAETPAHAHVTVVAPHSDHEAGLRLAAAYLFEETYALVGADAALPLVEGGARSAVIGRLELGLMLSSTLRCAARIELPLVGERLERRASAGFAWLF